MNSSRGFPVEVSPTSIALAPQEHRTFAVRISVPQSTSAGRDVLTVTVTSALHADVTAEAADLLYFTLATIVRSGVRLAEVDRELDQRALRITRRPGNRKDR